jgi:hypothetical protein
MPSVIDLSDARLRRDVEKLHRLGPRPLYHMLVELGCERSLRSVIEDSVARYAALDPVVVKALGADRFPGGGR